MISKLAGLGGGACVWIGSMVSLPTDFIGDLLISTPLAGAVGTAIWYFWPTRQAVTRQDIKDIYNAMDKMDSHHGVSQKEVVDAIKLGSDKLDRILREATAIRSPHTSRRIKHIDSIGRKIIEDFRLDPKDVRLAQNWLNSYLDETITLVRGYAQLSRTGARSTEAQIQMSKFDDMLDLIEEKFQELLDRLLSNDVMDFDVNLTVMQTRLKNEGI